MDSFYKFDELVHIGFKSLGNNVLISRSAKIYNPHIIEIGSNVRIDDFSFISGGKGIIFGNYIHISANVCIWGNNGLKIGDFVTISSGSRIFTESDDFSGNYLLGPMVPWEYRKTYGYFMTIYDYVNIGAGCTILPITHIPIGCAIGAHSLVTNILEPWSINIGVPAKFKKNRSMKLLECKKTLMEKL